MSERLTVSGSVSWLDLLMMSTIMLILSFVLAVATLGDNERRDVHDLEKRVMALESRK